MWLSSDTGARGEKKGWDHRNVSIANRTLIDVTLDLTDFLPHHCRNAEEDFAVGLFDG
jgi:hypothetical protein